MDFKPDPEINVTVPLNLPVETHFDVDKCSDDSVLQSPKSTISQVSNVDMVISVLGDFGRFQKLLFFALSFPAAAMAIGVYASVFTEYLPKHRCMDPCEDEVSYYPTPNWFDSDMPDSQCTRPQVVDHYYCQLNLSHVEQCSDFVYDDSVFKSTVISEFDAVCSNSYWRGISRSSYMGAMIFGSFFFGWFSDNFGRRMCFALTAVFLTGGSIGAAMSFNFPMYIVFRFITSIGGVGMFITSFVLCMEFIGPSYRTLCGFGIEIPFAVGELYVGLLAYFIRDWRTLQVVIAAPFLVFFLYALWLPESIRWALAKGKMDVAKETLKKMAKWNKIAISDEVIDGVRGGHHATEKQEGLVVVLASKGMRPRFLIMVANWVVTTLCYYGLGMSASLGENIFMTFMVTAVMEIPSYIFCMFAANRWGRKPFLAGMQILAALACVAAGCLPKHLYIPKLVFMMIGKFGASGSFAMVFVYTAELFPTPMRNTVVGLCSTCARFGGILAPLIIELGLIQPQLPFLIIGSLSLIVGIAACWLPETSGRELPDTLEEALALSVSSQTLVEIAA
eukprot:snap_masked-scaffold1505_size38140-processed-gene-0.0 protein:Tk08775 transcript:snap_masked-scaffold1505_size38140-processed-gene-0.0-mRNA-1 annotation:"organic cation transporter protein"